MSEKLDVRIITPARIVFKREAESVILPGTAGEMEVLAGHVAIFSTIKAGQITIRDGEKKAIFACGAGLLEVSSNKVTLLVDSAEGTAEIDPEEARKMIEEAEDKLKDIESLDEETRFAFETKLAAAKARIDVFERMSNETPDAEHGFSTFVEPIKPGEKKE